MRKVPAEKKSRVHNLWLTNTLLRVNERVGDALNETMLTLDDVHRRGILAANRCCLCQMEEESVNYLFLRCEKIKCLQELAFNLFGIEWVMGYLVCNTSKSWKCKAIRKNRIKVWIMIPHGVIQTAWRIEN